MSNQISSEIAAASTKVVPSLTLVGASVVGYSLPEIAAIVGIAFVLAQCAHLAWKWRTEYVDRQAFKAKMMAPVEKTPEPASE